LASAFRDAFVAKGGEVVAFEAEAADATNVEPLLTTIAASSPEFLYYPVFVPLGSLITNTARNVAGLENVQLAAADGVQSPTFLENVVTSGENMVVSGPDLAFSNTFYNDTFLPKHQEMFGTAPVSVFHAHSFDATNMLLNAIESVGTESADGTLLIGRQALRDALYATSGYEGVTGTLTCSEFGDCADAKISVSKIENGEFVRIWP
jgi:branched-chain amino acid transport system substrate-binding protein